MMEHPYAGTVALVDGRVATVRPLLSTDSAALGAMFISLSPATTRLYGPHRFDLATAERLCASIDSEPEVTRFVAVLGDRSTLTATEPPPAIIGYMILSRQIHPDDYARHGKALDLARCASLAPCIADAYQNQGIGTQMARHVFDCARRMGLVQVILCGGVQARNARGRHFYEKLGFRQVGEFWTHSPEELLNYSMVLQLA